jgi:type II secretory pathway pseudopilin PulG
MSLLELTVVVCVIAVLVTVGLERLLRYQELAEQTSMYNMVGTLRSALHLRAAAYIATQQPGQIAGLAKENPFDWLAERPYNFAGVRYNPNIGELEPGNWYYDGKSGFILYVPRSTRYFSPGKDGRKWARFRVEYAEAPFGAGNSPNPLREIRALGVQPVERVNWFEDQR